jgi:hypothetical protein
VAIRGVGVVSPLGSGRAAVSTVAAAPPADAEGGALEPACSPQPTQQRKKLLDQVPLPAGLAPSTAAGGFHLERRQVPGFDPRAHFASAKVLKLTDRRAELAVAAALAALGEAGLSGLLPEAAAAAAQPSDRLPSSADPALGERLREELAVVLGTSAGELRVPALAAALAGDPRVVEPGEAFNRRVLAGLYPLWLLQALPNMAAAHVAIRLGVRGPNDTRMTGAVAGLEALADAARMVAGGEVPLALAGAAEDASLPERVAGEVLRQWRSLPPGGAVAGGAPIGGEIVPERAARTAAASAPDGGAGDGNAGEENRADPGGDRGAEAGGGAAGPRRQTLGFGEAAALFVLAPFGTGEAAACGVITGGALCAATGDESLDDALAQAAERALVEAGWQHRDVDLVVPVPPVEELPPSTAARMPGVEVARWPAELVAATGALGAVAAPLVLARLLLAGAVPPTAGPAPAADRARPRRVLLLAIDPSGLGATLAVELADGPVAFRNDGPR